MNYEGCVTAVNTLLWTFDLDEKVSVHFGHLAVHNSDEMLPEIGEHVRIINAHFTLNKLKQLNHLFLCEKSSFFCINRKKYIREENLLNMISNFHLGISDLLQIDLNLATIEQSIKPLTECQSEHILFALINAVAKVVTSRSYLTHKCLNKIVEPFTVKTISNYHTVDMWKTDFEIPVWSFGTHSIAKPSDMLVGYLQINKRHGIVMLLDTNHKIPCLITGRNRIFSEIYKEADVPSLEYILFDINDVKILHVELALKVCPLLFNTVTDEYPFTYQFQFRLLQKFNVNFFKNGEIECWLKVMMNNIITFLCLNAHQVQVLPLLEEGAVYRVYHSVKLKSVINIELLRMNFAIDMLKFNEKSAVFICNSDMLDKTSDQILTVSEVLEQLSKTTILLSFQGLISTKKLTPALKSRTSCARKYVGFGTPGMHTHSLLFMDNSEEQMLWMYLNNWESLQIPLGLLPYMRICVRNAIPQKCKYLKSCAMTTFEVLSYEPPLYFNTANLSTNMMRECDQYSFVGWGNLLPQNVLIWACISELCVRSLKIVSGCEGDTIETVMTLYVADEMGQALIISKSIKLLRLLLHFEEAQWKMWCQAFKHVGQYTFNNNDEFTQDFLKENFCKALTFLIKLINATKMCNLELLCRKMDINEEDNEGMPKWFCIDARSKEVTDE